ncbi:hypothetical protein D3C78_1394490 [compost metagenome]
MLAGPGLHVGILRTVDHLGHVTQVDRCTVFVGNDQLGVLIRLEQLIVGRQRGNARLAVQCALGQVEAGLLKGQANVGQGQADGGELVGGGLYPNRRALLAGDVDLADAVDLAQLACQQGLGVVAQLSAGHLRRADAENQHRAVGRIDLAPGRQRRHVLG